MATIFCEVFERIGHTLPKPPFVSLTRSDPFGRVYTVYLYVEHPEDVFTIRPQISEEVFKRWDIERNATRRITPTHGHIELAQQESEKKEEKDEKQRKT